LPSLFGIRRRLSTSATCTSFTTCGQLDQFAFISALCSRRDGDLDLLPFLSHHASLSSGDERRAALSRSFESAPVLVLSGCPDLPNRDANSIAPPSRLAPRCIARINVYRSKDRAKDASSISHMQQTFDLCVRGVRALCGARVTNVPLLGDLRTSAVIGSLSPREDTRCDRPNRSRPSFQQCPAKETAFPKTRMPFTATTREGACLGLLVLLSHTTFRITPSNRAPSRRLSRSRRPHFLPIAGESVFDGHCEVTVR
jgi:hypothetical protein